MKSIYSILFLFLLLASACEPGEQRVEVDIHDNDTINDRDEPVDPNDTDRVDEATITDDELVGHPWHFGDASVENLRKTFDDFEIENLEEVENRHIRGQIDTSYTIRAGGSTWEIYYVNERSLLESASIQSDEVQLNRNIRVGMTTEEFENEFAGQLDEPLDQNATVDIEHSMVPSFLTVQFHNGRINEIHYAGYVD